MNIVVVGAGAIGLLFYQALNRQLNNNHPDNNNTGKSGITDNNNIEVRLLHKNKQLSQQQFACSNYKHYSQQFKLQFAQPHDIKNADIILVCVKSYQVQTALTAIINQLKQDAMIILSHNGMGTVELKKIIQPTLLLLTTHGAKLATQRHLLHTGEGQHFLGYLNKVTQQTKELIKPKLNTFMTVLNNTLPELIWQEDMLSAQWYKLAINCVINPLTAINNIDNGEILNRQYLPAIKQILQELSLVAKAEHINLSVPSLLTKVEQVALATKLNTSSMRADVLAGKATEIDYINGYICQLGKQHKIATPKNTELVAQVKAL